MPLQNPLWQFVLQIYSDPEVERACLQLQNECELSINRLLFAVWLATQGRRYEPESPVLAAATHWQQQITHPLRSVRYRVRAMRDEQPSVADVYQQLRRAELAAEQQELALLWQVHDAFAEAQPDKSLLSENLTLAAQQTGHPALEALLSLLGPRLFGAQPSE